MYSFNFANNMNNSSSAAANTEAVSSCSEKLNDFVMHTVLAVCIFLLCGMSVIIDASIIAVIISVIISEIIIVIINDNKIAPQRETIAALSF